MKEAEWTAIIEECRNSGSSIKVWCEKYGIAYRRYRYWVKKLEGKQPQWAQVPVTITSNEIVHNGIKLNCGKWTIEVDNETSAQLLRDVLQAVDEICC